MAKFSSAKASAHIRRHHPGCPEFAVEYMAREIAQKEWHGVSLGRAVGITMQGILRHLMTDYDTLLLEGVSRPEAKRRVQPKVRRYLAVWAKPPEAVPVEAQKE